MKYSMWPKIFKVLDRFLKNDKYLQFKSMKMPDVAVPRGLSVSTDSTVRIKKGYIVRKNKEIDFYNLRKTNDIFEIRFLTHREKKTYFTVYHVASDFSFQIEEKAFRLLFVPVEQNEFYCFKKDRA